MDTPMMLNAIPWSVSGRVLMVLQGHPPDGIQDENYNYDGLGPYLCWYISNKFNTVLQACGVTGGLTHQQIK